MSEPRQEGKILLMGKYRRPWGSWRFITVGLPLVAIILGLLNIFIWTPFGFVMTPVGYSFALIAVFLPLTFLWIPINKKVSKEGVPWYDMVLATLSCAIPLWFTTQQFEILMSTWESGAPPVPFILAAILMFLVIEAARRAAGPVLAGTVLVIALYPLWACYSPISMLWGQCFDFHRLASQQVIGRLGLLGLPMKVFGKLVMGFLVFAVAIQAAGAGDFFMDLANSLIRKTRAGNAKVAIVASAMFATISGAAVPNVLTTGAFTIPAMKKEGLPAHFAGAVEACASAGGTITPPVMGSAAFLMAEFIGISYAEVALYIKG